MVSSEGFASEDDAAAAIQAIMDRAAGAPEPEPAPEPQPEPAPVAATPEPEPEITEPPAEASPPQEEVPPVEAAPKGETEPPPQTPEAPKAPQAPPKAQEQPQYAQASQLDQLSQYIPQLQARLSLEFPDIKTVTDLQRVATEDPARAIRFQVQREEIQSAQEAHNRLFAESINTWKAAEAAELRKHPEFADPVAGHALEQRVLKYATTDLGYKPEDLQRVSARDVIMAYESMMYRDSLKQKAAEDAKKAKALEDAKAKAKEAPPVQKPGVSQPKASAKEEKVKELEARYAKSGRVDDLAAVLAAREAL